MKYLGIARGKRKFVEKRKQGDQVEGYPDIRNTDIIGRVYTVHPNQFECFCLRILLHNVRGPMSFEHLRTVNGEVFTGFREACLELGLLEDDRHWDETLEETEGCRVPRQLRSLFAVMLMSCEI